MSSQPKTIIRQRFVKPAWNIHNQSSPTGARSILKTSLPLLYRRIVREKRLPKKSRSVRGGLPVLPSLHRNHLSVSHKQWRWLHPRVIYRVPWLLSSHLRCLLIESRTVHRGNHDGWLLRERLKDLAKRALWSQRCQGHERKDQWARKVDHCWSVGSVDGLMRFVQILWCRRNIPHGRCFYDCLVGGMHSHFILPENKSINNQGNRKIRIMWGYPNKVEKSRRKLWRWSLPYTR